MPLLSLAIMQGWLHQYCNRYQKTLCCVSVSKIVNDFMEINNEPVESAG
jgi:hypothetical protein